MSERILRALMQLFAIIAKVDGVTNTGRNIVQLFLKQQLNQELVDQYLAVFDEFLESHHQVAKKKDGTEKRTSLNSVKVLKICTEINRELEQNQKIVVLIRLLEFIYSSNEISEQENEFVTTVAETFNISVEEFNNLKYFVEGKQTSINSHELLVINDKEQNTKAFKHIYCDQFNEDIEVWVIAIPSVGMYALKLVGNQELVLNGQAITPDKIYMPKLNRYTIRISSVNFWLINQVPWFLFRPLIWNINFRAVNWACAALTSMKKAVSLSVLWEGPEPVNQLY
jgi:uncharacterized tellurite resistance protein B-like protein